MAGRRAGGLADMVGRDAEVERVMSVLESVTKGRGASVLITGEPGIGKTSLLKAALDDAAERFLVVAEAASELEVALPFAPLIRGLKLGPDSCDGAAEVRRLLEQTGVVDANLQRLLTVEAIVDLIEQWAVECPVLLAIDDLHWADSATVQVLDRLARRQAHVAVALILTARPHPIDASAQALQRTLADRAATQVQLRPLADEVVRRLAVDLVHAELGPRLSQALRHAGGNPLYARELLAGAEVQASAAGPVAELPEDGLPTSLRQTILRNLGSLPSSTTDVLRVASVLGPRFELRQLAVVLDRTEIAIADLLAPALAAVVIVDGGDELRFRHHVVWEAIYLQQPDSVRLAAHRHVVARFHEAELPVTAVVPHLLRAEWHGIPEAVGWLAEAGRATRASHPPTAVQLFSRAVETAGDGADPRLRLDLAETLLADIRPDEAVRAIEPVISAPLDELPEDVRDRLITFTGPPFGSAAATDEVRERLLEALEGAGLGSVGRHRAMVTRAWTHWMEGQLAHAHDMATRALGLDVDDHAGASILQTLLARLAEGQGRVEDKLAHARAALAHGRQVPAQPELELNASATLGIMLGATPGSEAEADAVVTAAQRLAQRTGMVVFQAALDAVAGLNAERRGDWDNAAAAYEAAFEAFPSSRPLTAGTAQFYARAARLAVHRDDLRQADELVGVATDMANRAAADGREPDELAYVHIAEAEVAVALGDHVRARHALERLAAFVETRDAGVYRAVTLPTVLTVAMEAGDAKRARSAVERAEEWLSETRSADPDLEGVVEWARARVEGCHERLRPLVPWADTRRLPWEWRPQIREHLADCLAGAGHQDEAVDHLLEALELWETAGARRDVARVRHSLRELGVIRGRGASAGRPASGWESLTDAEWRVVELIREGLIYREIAERLFISRRTVESHVRHVFAKLDVSSRRDVVRLLNAEDPTHRAARGSL